MCSCVHVYLVYRVSWSSPTRPDVAENCSLLGLSHWRRHQFVPQQRQLDDNFSSISTRPCVCFISAVISGTISGPAELVHVRGLFSTQQLHVCFSSPAACLLLIDPHKSDPLHLHTHTVLGVCVSCRWFFHQLLQQTISRMLNGSTVDEVHLSKLCVVELLCVTGCFFSWKLRRSRCPRCLPCHLHPR